MSGPTNFSTFADFQVSWDRSEFEVRFVNGVEYFTSPTFATLGGAQWIKFTPIAPPIGIPQTDRPTGLGGLSNNGVQFLAGVNSAQLVGTSVIDRVPVTQYSFTTSLEKAVQADPGLIDLGLVELLTSRSSQVDITHMPGDVWLDDQGRVRRMNLSVSGHGFALVMANSFNHCLLCAGPLPVEHVENGRPGRFPGG